MGPWKDEPAPDRLPVAQAPAPPAPPVAAAAVVVAAVPEVGAEALLVELAELPLLSEPQAERARLLAIARATIPPVRVCFTWRSSISLCRPGSGCLVVEARQRTPGDRQHRRTATRAAPGGEPRGPRWPGGTRQMNEG